MEDFWTWAKADRTNSDGYLVSWSDRCEYFKKEIWFELGECMYRRHCYTFKEHIEYIHNEIVKNYRVRTFHKD